MRSFLVQIDVNTPLGLSTHFYFQCLGAIPAHLPTSSCLLCPLTVTTSVLCPSNWRSEGDPIEAATMEAC